MISPRHTTAAGYISIDALPDEACPHCRAENIGRAVSVRRVADNRGMHFACDVCAHACCQVRRPSTAVSSAPNRPATATPFVQPAPRAADFALIITLSRELSPSLGVACAIVLKDVFRDRHLTELHRDAVSKIGHAGRVNAIDP